MSDLSVSQMLKPPAHPAIQQAGRVVTELGEGLFLVEQDGQGYACRHAASCLLLPEPGDEVLLAHVAGQAWILAVLQRAGQAAAQLRVDGDLVIASTRGAVRLEAGTALGLQSESLQVEAEHGVIQVAQMRFSGTLWQGAIGTARLVGQVCETLVDRVMQISKLSFRRVEQIDHVRAAQLDYEGSARVRIRSKYTAVTAKNILKAKGRQVHIG